MNVNAKKLKLMETYLYLFHDAVRNANAWLLKCANQSGYAQEVTIMNRFGYIPHDIFEANVEEYFARSLDNDGISPEEKKDLYMLFCRFFKKKVLQ